MMELRSNPLVIPQTGRITEQLCRDGDKMMIRIGLHEAGKRGLDESLSDCCDSDETLKNQTKDSILEALRRGEMSLYGSSRHVLYSEVNVGL